MIRVEYDAPALRLWVEGHAQSGPPGQDLVCAAVSGLTVTLAEALRQMESQGRGAAELRIGSGSAFLAFRPEAEHQKEARIRMETVFLGLRLLGEKFPRNMKVIAE